MGNKQSPGFLVAFFRKSAKSGFFRFVSLGNEQSPVFFRWVCLGNEQSPGVSGGFHQEISKVPVSGGFSLGSKQSPGFSGEFL